jgi:hypothetical protein
LGRWDYNNLVIRFNIEYDSAICEIRMFFDYETEEIYDDILFNLNLTFLLKDIQRYGFILKGGTGCYSSIKNICIWGSSNEICP